MEKQKPLQFSISSEVYRASLVAKWERICLPMQEMQEGMATHPSTLAWRIPWTEEPGSLIVHGVAEESDMTE